MCTMCVVCVCACSMCECVSSMYVHVCSVHVEYVTVCACAHVLRTCGLSLLGTLPGIV